jgi:hypothetical protein
VLLPNVRDLNRPRADPWAVQLRCVAIATGGSGIIPAEMLFAQEPGVTVTVFVMLLSLKPFDRPSPFLCYDHSREMRHDMYYTEKYQLQY